MTAWAGLALLAGPVTVSGIAPVGAGQETVPPEGAGHEAPPPAEAAPARPEACTDGRELGPIRVQLGSVEAVTRGTECPATGPPQGPSATSAPSTGTKPHLRPKGGG